MEKSTSDENSLDDIEEINELKEDNASIPETNEKTILQKENNIEQEPDSLDNESQLNEETEEDNNIIQNEEIKEKDIIDDSVENEFTREFEIKEIKRAEESFIEQENKDLDDNNLNNIDNETINENEEIEEIEDEMLINELKGTHEYVDVLNNSVKLHFRDNEVIYEDKNESNRNHIVKHNNKRIKKKKIIKKSKGKIIIGILLLTLIVFHIFNGKLFSRYYIYKSETTSDEVEKLTYSVQALKNEKNEKTVGLLKLTFLSIESADITLAENQLKELKSYLTESEYNNFYKILVEKNIKMLCSKSKYEDAFNEFSNLNKIDIDFKENENYDDIMLNIISNLTGSPVRGNKGILIDDSSICYDNFDDDIYDEIIQVEENIGYKSNPVIKIKLYKFSDGKYRHYDSVTLNNTYDKGIQGIYYYTDNKKAVYVHYNSETVNAYATSVYSVEDDRLVLKGTVYGSNYTKPQDADNDGSYEIAANNGNFNSEDDSKYYKFNSDSNSFKEISISKKESDNSNVNMTEDYIFDNSDSEYLTAEELEKLNKEELALARNEIFARHGYKFKEEPFKSYFNSKKWYKADENYKGNDSSLNKYEIANYKMIQEYEE